MDISIPPVALVPISITSCGEWVSRVATNYGVDDWTKLTVSQRKVSLYQLSCSKDKGRFEEVVQYVIQKYSDCPVEDLSGDESLLVALSTPLAVKVVKNHCSERFSLKPVPSLMKQGICPRKLEKILKTTQEYIGRRSVIPNAHTPIPRIDSGSEIGGIRSDGGVSMGGGIQSEGPQPFELSLQLRSFKSQAALQITETRNFLEHILEKDFRNEMEELKLNLDIYCQRMLSLCGYGVNLNNCPTRHGNILHAAAKFGLAESAKEALAQGYYNMLLELDHKKPNTWPLYYAVGNQQWSTLKVFLETLNFSQRQSQMRSIVGNVDCEKIIKEVRDYQKQLWMTNIFRHEDLKLRTEMEGRALLIKAVLDTTMRGCDVDASLLLTCNEDKGSVDDDGDNTTDQTDDDTKTPNKSLYKLISESDVEELKCHPSFAAVVQHKWKRGYAYVHVILSILYLVYLILLTVALALAAKSPDPRDYNVGLDALRLFFEILCFLYISTVIVINSVIFVADLWSHYQSPALSHSVFFMDLLSVYSFFEILRYFSTLLIIPLRIANNSFQWQMTALAIILSGLRLFRYASVWPFMGKYVGTLLLLVKYDLPRLLGVFIVINFSFGAGLYFTLVGHYNDDNVDITNNNSTSEVYLLWMSGVRMVIEGSVLTYNGTGGFNLSGRFVYWLFVFCVSVVFAAILIAQFETSYNQLADKANLNVILKKTDFMKKMDRVLFTFCWIFKHTPCMEVISSIFDEECGDIRRKVLEDPDNLDPKDYVVETLSRKLAENDKRVQILEGKLDIIHELLMKKNS